jgi:L-seryl-tRNA(Ser) seleniumtransferase
MNIYAKLGVRTLINAAGSLTRLGGTLMPPEVLQAMTEAAQAFVSIDELQARASQIIAEITGAEAGYVTSGAAAGLALATAACVTGLDPAKINRLPDTAGLKDEVLIPKGQRDGYDHAVRAVGVRLVEVGMPYRTYPYEIDAAINERTAAVLYIVARSKGTISLPNVLDVARQRGVPVIVDAAAELPPAANLRAFIAQGADLVVFSGGKALRGPQASGILCGRRDLIAAAALQHLDMDVDPATWSPPGELIDRSLVPGPPEQGLGRMLKVGKEEIVGLLTALRLYIARDHAADQRTWEAQARHIAASLAGFPGVRTEVIPAELAGPGLPQTRITLDEASLGLTAYDLIRRLKAGEPSIHVVEYSASAGAIEINPMNLQPGEAELVIERLRQALQET